MSSHAVALWGTAILFTIVYVGLGVGKLPGLRIDRAGIALVGATALLVTGLLPPGEAVGAVDFGTIVLLFGMMVVVAYLRLSGFFERLTRAVFARVTSPLALLATLMALSGVLSAFLVNVVVCLALAPMAMQVARRAKRSPLPYLIGLATSANVGSVATLTGNPQNMIIGSLSKIPYARFSSRLAPLGAIALVVGFGIVALVYRRALAEEVKDVVGARDRASLEPSPPSETQSQRWMLAKGAVVTLGAVILFFAGFPVALVALGAAAVLMLGRVRPERIYRQIDWNTLVMFAGLFLVVHAFEKNVVATWSIERWAASTESRTATLTVLAAILSNLVSNVPAVLLFKPLVTGLAGQARDAAWLTLAMASTFAGNLTVLGSVANLIVIEGARREGVTISFWEYCRVGAPVALATLTLGALWLAYVAG